MIATLAFGDPVADGRGRRLRSPRFVPRSTLPLGAACVVANGLREQLSRQLACELDVELIEPAVPGPAERRTLLDRATIVRVRGRLCDAFVIVRPADGRRLAVWVNAADDPVHCDFTLPAVYRAGPVTVTVGSILHHRGFKCGLPGHQ